MINMLILLIPIGLCSTIIGIIGVVKSIKKKVIYEVPFKNGGGVFTIAEEKTYGICMSGKMFRRNPIAELEPHLRSIDTGEALQAAPSLLRFRTTRMDSTGRIELYTFKAKPGQYTISFIGKGLAIDRAISYIADTIIPYSDTGCFQIQITEHVSIVLFMLSIWGIILGVSVAVAGMILPFALGGF